MLAVGGQLKATFALGRGFEAIVSQHIGDMDQYENYRAYVAAIGHYEELYAFRPRLLVHDLHPDYVTTRYAIERHNLAPPGGISLLGVQHHHAHMAGCLAENRLVGPVIGVVFDGTGFGLDGAIWGGEFLVGDCATFRRAAHVRYVALPGGDQAIREPWRMAAAHLLDAGQGLEMLADRVPATSLATVERMIAQRINSPPTSSVGRLFDAVAVIAGAAGRVSHEAQAATELEGEASLVETDEVYPFEASTTAGVPQALAIIDTRPLIAAIAGDVRNGYTRGRIGRKFHSTLAQIIAIVCTRLRDQTGIESVVLSGGVFANSLLLTDAVSRLSSHGLRAHFHHQTPPNDGGLSFGQLAVAAARKGIGDVSWHSGQSR
jgi:hydrogenase maturation protein HypF